MDEDLRKLIEIARVDSEFALQEVRRFGLARIEVIEIHIASLVACLDEILLRADAAKLRQPPPQLN